MEKKGPLNLSRPFSNSHAATIKHIEDLKDLGSELAFGRLSFRVAFQELGLMSGAYVGGRFPEASDFST